MGPSKMGPSKMGPSKMSPSKMGPSKMGPSMMGPSKICPWWNYKKTAIDALLDHVRKFLVLFHAWFMYFKMRMLKVS